MPEQLRQHDVRPIADEDRREVCDFLAARWQSPVIVTRAETHDASTLPGYLVREHGRLVGVVTLSVRGRDCEVVTIDSLVEGQGFGATMLAEAESWARAQGCDRTWLVTTNDNLRALRFYQRRGYRIISVHRDAVQYARELKPEIPLVAENGIALMDELELEKAL